jgi:hypothetical protein
MDTLDSAFSETTQQKVKRGARGLPFSLFRRRIPYLLMLRVVLGNPMMVVLDIGVPAVVPVMRRSAVHRLWCRSSSRGF